MLSAKELHARVSWPVVLERFGVEPSLLALNGRRRARASACPACGGNDRFTFDDRHGRGDYFCRGCGAGDGLSLLMKMHRWTLPQAIQQVARGERIGVGQPAPKSRVEDVSRPLDWSAKAEAIWQRTQPLTGTAGEIYLKHRKCKLPPSDSDLRFLPSTDRYPPSLCAAITDAMSGKRISLHFTRLGVDGCGKAGTERDKLLLAGHRKAGGVIRLWPDEAVSNGLAVSEGIETALSVAHVFTPVWACVDAGNLAVFPVLTGIESLTIVADADDAGRKAAKSCANRWSAEQREVNVVIASQEGDDFNDCIAEAA